MNMRKKKHKKQIKKYISNSRLFILIGTICCLMVAIFFRLYWLQVYRHSFFAVLAEKQYKNKMELLPRRGDIMLKDKDNLIPVAVNQDMPTVYIVPLEIKDKMKVAHKLSEILSLKQDFVDKKIFKENDPYEIIKKKISKEEYDKLKKENLIGVHFEQERWRYYPNNELASQTIGFLGYSENGMAGHYGVEQYFDKVLAGQKGLSEGGENGNKGNLIAMSKKLFNPSLDGSKLILTLNPTIQFKAEIALENAVKKHGADGGKIIIIEPKSGKILAMTSRPTFDLNNYNNFDVADFRNPIISSAYEPGSVFKIITMAAGLDSNRVSPGTTYIDKGVVQIAGFNIKNSDEKAYGEQTMTEVINKSLNTGVIFVEKKIGNKLFADYIKKFGFGEKTGIKLPSEIKGNINNLKTKRDINFYTASYGQGISITPLQLAMAYGVFANQGILMKPLVVDTVVDINGNKKIMKPKAVRQVISTESARQATLMLESNVEHGHGKLAGVPGYRIAGKTGTAQIPDRQKGGYLEDATVGTFAGFAPVDSPVFVMVVIIDHPRDTEWAAGTAAPVFGELSKFLLNYFAIEPTKEYSTKDLEVFDKRHNYLDIVIEEEEDDENKDENSKTKE